MQTAPSRTMSRTFKTIDVLLLLLSIFILALIAMGGIHSYWNKPYQKNVSDLFKALFGLIAVRMALAKSWDPLNVPIVQTAVHWFQRVTNFSTGRLLGMTLVYGFILFLAACASYTMIGGGHDLSLHLNYLYNAKAGNGFITYIEPATDHLLNNHMYLIEYPIWLLYSVFPTPYLVFFIQSFVLVSGGVAVFLCARTVLTERWQQVLMALVYLVYPRMRNINLYDFHPDVFFVPIMLLAFYFFLNNRRWLCVVMALIGCTVKETSCLTVGFFGIYLLFQKRWDKKQWILPALIVMAAGLGGFWLYRGVHLKSVASAGDQIKYYAWLGNSLPEVFSSVVSTPGKFLGTLMSPERLRYVIGILVPLGFLPILAPTLFAITIPTWGYLMAREPFLFTIFEHHPCDLMPYLFVAFIFGYLRLLTWAKPNSGSRLAGKSRLVTFVVVVFAFATYGTSEIYVIHSYLYKNAAFAPFVKYMRAIPTEHTVASTWDNYLPQIGNRQYVFKWQDIKTVQRPVNIVLINEKLEQSVKYLEDIKAQGYTLAFQDGSFSAYSIENPTPVESLLDQLGWPPRKKPAGVLP